MRSMQAVLVCCAVPLVVATLHAQNNVVLGRVLGQNTLVMQSAAKNLVEGREMTNPQGVALDTSVSPATIYVSDAGNNRVLGWRNSASFQNGAFADIVIGQKDLFTTNTNGPGTNLTQGLNSPTGLLVDGQGNLYVLDSGNNRILRYAQPFNQTDSFKAPSQVIGQTDYNHGGNNTGGIGAGTLSFTTGSGPLRGSMALDAQGNLWVTDSGNNRVLRFPKDPANSGQVVTTADLVLGQSGFTTSAATGSPNVLNQFNWPSGMAFDSSGNLYVSDRIHRVLVFKPPFASGMSASTMLGGILGSGPNSSLNPPTASSLYSPESVTIVPGTNEVLVSDTYNNRVLKFPPVSQWPQIGVASATLIVGQPDARSNTAGVGASLLSAPVQVAVAGGELFIADSLNNRVVVVPQNSTAATRVLGQLGLNYNAPNLIEGRELYMVGFLPIGGNQYAPIGGGLALDASGATPHLYIADPGNNRVLGYCNAWKAKQGDKADLVVGQPDLFSSQANGNGGTTPDNQHLRLPGGVAVDASGNLFVADTGNSRVLRFAAPCSQPAVQQSFPAANLVIGQADFTHIVTDVTDKTMRGPIGVAVTPEGYLLVSDMFHNRVLRFEKPSAGDFGNGQSAAAVFGQQDMFSAATGSLTNQMNAPRHITVDGSGRLYVADFSNNRVLVFTDAGHAPSNSAAVLAVSASDQPTHILNGPYGVGVSPATGEIVVAPANENRVLRYPAFSTLAAMATPYASAQTPTATNPLDVIEDAQGDAFVAETGNRISEYFFEIDPVNGASFLVGRALAPGMLASVWTRGKPAQPTGAQGLPLPTSLAGMQVYVGGVAAPLLYAGNSPYSGIVQINFQIPGSAPSSGFIDAQVVDSTTGQVYGAGSLPMASAAPAFFMANPATGLVAAHNVDPKTPNIYTCNGPTAGATSGCPNGTRPANRGEIVEFYLTGQGLQSGWPADGQTASSGVTDVMPQVLMGTQFVPAANVQYSGVAPCCVGLWQVNVVVPNDNVAPDPQILNPVVVFYRDVYSTFGGIPKTGILIQ